MSASASKWDADNIRALPGYPWLPCPICKGAEGCDHAAPERARAANPAVASMLIRLTPTGARD